MKWLLKYFTRKKNRSKNQIKPNFNKRIWIDGKEIGIVSNVDKCEGFIYHTCYFSDGSHIVLSRFDGEELLLAQPTKIDADLVSQIISSFKNE